MKSKWMKSFCLAASFALFSCGSSDGKNGVDGANGTNGTNASIRTAAEPAGLHCPNGGIKIEVLMDGVVQETQTQYICNGENGTNGTNGTNGINGANGTNGTNATIQTSVEPAADNCANGGVKVEVLLDGVVQAEQTQYICNGENGHVGCDSGYYYSELINSCVQRWVKIPAGSFTLTHETAEHTSGETVTLQSFKLGKTPVTVAEFEKCVEAKYCTSDHYYTLSSGGSCCNYNRGDVWLNHPMNCVDWYGAKQYCEWIGGRLPSEEEWEYASTHNGTEHLNTTYAWGNDAPQHCVTANYSNYYSNSSYCNGTVETSSVVGTSEVGTYSPAGDSPLGLVDMTGNVYEWTESLYITGSSERVLKGGAWGYGEDNLPVTVHGGEINLTDWSSTFGFRCAE